MSSFLVLILCLTAIQCQDICHLIQTSGHFNGLQVYHSYPSDKLFMYKNGIKWQFEIKLDSKSNDYSLQMIPNTSQTIDSNIINMFGGYDSTSGYDCNVYHQPKDSTNIVTYCTDRSIHSDYESQYNPKSVVFKTTENDNNLVLIYDKTKPKILCYDTRKEPKNRLIDLIICIRYKPFPTFITDMTPDFLESIVGVVDYKMNPLFGHILFFNINGRPKYCYQRIDEKLECNSNEALKPLFEQCFRGSGDQNGNTTEWVLGVIGVIVIIGLFVLGIYYLIKLNKDIDTTGNQFVTRLSARRNILQSIAKTSSRPASTTATTNANQTSMTSHSSAKPTEKLVSTKSRDSSAVTIPQQPKGSHSSKSKSSQPKPNPI